MNEVIQVNALVISVTGAVITLLLAIIAVFMGRLLARFDKLTETVGDLNTVMTRDVALLKQQNETAQKEMEQIDHLWELARGSEKRLFSLERGGCEVRCNHSGHRS